MADTSGAYFYIDEQDGVMIADAEQRIQRVKHRQDEHGDGPRLDSRNSPITAIRLALWPSRR
ncbi:hypothetical protein SAMN04487857_12717 [Pseudomonas sp. ok272]|uniref:hypothetical protein n=1 Tax=unclassified Pseudomonas TaxID=196821 RepID=UPI0008C11971|nr:MULTISPECIES: hypothetical protein [unclassified Pseudomonas]SEN62861.1 hypothetical protein SAMN04487857_12717 [Pseudomonas sp. ok272]SFN41004.1 hypothetical protein SAMN04487858_12617 [Pseudomonas sp. ok602]